MYSPLSTSSLQRGQFTTALVSSQAHLLHRIMCLHLLKTMFLQFAQQIMQKCSSSTSGLYLADAPLFFRSLNRFEHTLDIFLNRFRIERWQKIVTTATNIPEQISILVSLDYRCSNISDLVSPKYRGTTVPLSRSQQRMRGTLVMREAPMVRVPHLGPLISTSSVLLWLNSSACRMSSGRAANVAMVYLKMTFSDPGFSDSKRLSYLTLCFRIMLFVIVGNLNVHLSSALQSRSLDLSQISTCALMFVSISWRILVRGTRLKKTWLLPTSQAQSLWKDLEHRVLTIKLLSVEFSVCCLTVYSFGREMTVYSSGREMTGSVCRYLRSALIFLYSWMTSMRVLTLKPRPAQQQTSEMFYIMSYLV